MKRMNVKCQKCGECFEYLKKRSYVRKYCDKCGLDIKSKSVVYMQKDNKHIRFGIDNGNYKGKVELFCKICNNGFFVIPASKDVRKCCSYDCYRVWCSLKISGKNNPKYVDGRRTNDYGGKFTNLLKEKIRGRDKRVCQYCGMEEQHHKSLTRQRLIVHHIDYNKKNNDEKNLISLCCFCHNKICSSNKNDFLNVFMEKISEIYGGRLEENI